MYPTSADESIYPIADESMSADESLACLDGEIMLASEATIPATDEGLIRGDGAFEVIRIYDGRPFAMEEHFARLERSAANIRLPLDLESGDHLFGVHAQLYNF